MLIEKVSRTKWHCALPLGSLCIVRMVNSIYGCEEGNMGMMKCDMSVGVGAHEAIKGARHDERAVSVEVYCGDIVDMGVQRFGASTCV